MHVHFHLKERDNINAELVHNVLTLVIKGQGDKLKLKEKSLISLPIIDKQ